MDKTEAFSFMRDVATLMMAEAPARQSVFCNLNLKRTVQITENYVKITASPLEGNKGMYGFTKSEM